ncbi:MAG: hypothetical protein CVU05_00570 [Bacteroidetes bacterium HGW-Bacteroidetes-21]|jgi:polysaccharide export outer membrane protein|nr:MAG: hypothetical protein CVU05_00570 [Bacteroidetes bacterium HGW-Bacteroidetes-21]
MCRTFYKVISPVSLLLLMVIVLLPSCKMLTSSDFFKTEKDFSYAEFKPSEKEYRIQPFDKMDLKIYTNDGYKLVDVSNTPMTQNQILYNVEFDGQVKLPSLGRVALAGMTLREAESMLETKYAEFFIEPFVMLSVVNKRVIVFSGGSSSGQVLEMKNDNYTLIEALADAGGISQLSKSYKIKLLRGELTAPQIFVFNIRSIKDMQKANFVLQANDIIYVETRPAYGTRIVTEISPYLSILSSVLLVYGLFLR